jgi:hypothetical protein
LDGLHILAEGLSRELQIQVASVELAATAFRWQVTAFRAGLRMSQVGFGGQPVAEDGPMPVYPDAELKAYRALLGVGVPATLALWTPEAVGAKGPAVVEDVVHWDGRAAGHATRQSRAVGHPDAEPPVRLLPSAADGVVFEPRAVGGRATVEALRGLLALEKAYRGRVPATQQSLDLRFVYQRKDETELDPMRELRRLEDGEGDSLLARILRRWR